MTHPEKMRIAITGSSGLVGGALAAALKAEGHGVIRLVRRPPREPEEQEWNASKGVLEPERLEALDGIVTLQGANIAGGRWTERRKQLLRTSRIDAIQTLVNSLKDLETPPKAWVSASGIGIYGAQPKGEADEDHPVGPGFLAELARDWEAAAEGARELGCRVALARFGVILSPRGGALAKLLPLYRLGLGGVVAGGEGRMSWIALDDAVGVLEHLLREELEGPVNAVAPRAVTQRDFTRTLGRVLRRPTVFPVPASALRLAFGQMAEETLLADQNAVPARLLGSGYRFRFPELEGALRHLLGRATGPQSS